MSIQATHSARPDADGLLVRRRLLSALDRAAAHPIVLVAAPAGYGKTTLLGQWAQGLEHVHRLDGSDPQVWQSAQRALAGDDVVVIVDDAHEAGWGQPFIRTVAAAHARAHLVLASRTDPLLALHQARLSGNVAELRRHDLAFTLREVKAVATRAGVPVDATRADALMERTAGWPAGVRLSLGTLGDHDDVSAFSATGSYLLSHVLGAVEPEMLAVLQATAVPESFDTALARELTQRADAASVVAEFAHRVGFVTREGTLGTFRYHRMVRRLLLSELVRTDPDRVEALNAIAGRHSFDAGRYEEAARHATTAKDWGLVADSAVALTCSHLGSGDWTLVDSVMAAVPPVFAHRDARMRALQVWQSMRTGDHQTPAAPLPKGRRSVSNDPATRERVAVLETLSRAWVALDTGQIGTARSLLATPAPPLSDADNRPGAPGATLRAVWGSIRAFLAVTCGALDEVEDELGNAERLGQGTIPLIVMAAYEVRLWAALAVGDLAQATRTADQWTTSSPLPSLSLPGAYTFGRRWVGVERGEALDDGAVEPAPPSVMPPALLDELEAITTVRSTTTREDVVPGRHRADVPWILARFALLAQVEDCLARSDFARARSVISAESRRCPDLDPRPFACWVSTAESVALRDVATPSRVDEVIDDPRTPEDLRIRIMLCAAAAALAADEVVRAAPLLRRALASTERHGWRRPWRALGPSAVSLLTAERDRVGTHAEIATALLVELRELRDGAGVGLIVALSAREEEILQYLPTSMDQGELCAALFISRNTLKTHLRSIYRKLGVAARREAVLRAQQAGLL